MVSALDGCGACGERGMADDQGLERVNRARPTSAAGAGMDVRLTVRASERVRSKWNDGSERVWLDGAGLVLLLG